MRIFMKSEFAGYDPVFANNSWASIKNACQNNEIPSTWQIGDTKELLGKDGNTYHIRLSDKQSGRYTYSNSTKTTNAVFEFVELPDIVTEWNRYSTNAGGFADSQARKNLNGLDGVQTNKDFLNQIIPNELAGLLEEVNIITSTGGSSFTGTSTSANKLFIPCYINIKETTDTQYVAEGSLWDYYITHNTNNDRKKAVVTDATNYQSYWTASPYAGYLDSVRGVGIDGSVGLGDTQFDAYMSPCWAW